MRHEEVRDDAFGLLGRVAIATPLRRIAGEIALTWATRALGGAFAGR